MTPHLRRLNEETGELLDDEDGFADDTSRALEIGFEGQFKGATSIKRDDKLGIVSIDVTFTISAPYQLAEELAQPAMTLMSRPPNEVMDIVVTPRPPMQRKLGL